MMPSYLTRSEIQGKITGLCNISHSDLQNRRILQCETDHVPKFDAYLLNRARYIREINHQL